MRASERRHALSTSLNPSTPINLSLNLRQLLPRRDADRLRHLPRPGLVTESTRQAQEGRPRCDLPPDRRHLRASVPARASARGFGVSAAVPRGDGGRGRGGAVAAVAQGPSPHRRRAVRGPGMGRYPGCEGARGFLAAAGGAACSGGRGLLHRGRSLLRRAVAGSCSQHFRVPRVSCWGEGVGEEKEREKRRGFLLLAPKRKKENKKKLNDDGKKTRI